MGLQQGNKDKTAMWRLLCVSLILVGLSSINAAQQELKKNVSEFMEVGYSRGRVGTRVTELAVTVQHNDMFEGEEDVDMDILRIEVKAEDGCWTNVEGKPVRRGKDKRMWRVKVIPCKKYFVRLGIKRDGCIEYHEHPTTVGPASSEEIENSHFRPSKPENVGITTQTDDSVSVSWTPSECSESHELLYESHDGDDSGNITVNAGMESVTIKDLKNCTDYSVYVTAVVGEEFSDEAEADFSTCYEDTEEGVPDKKPDDSATRCEPVEKECEVEEDTSTDITMLELVVLDQSEQKETAEDEKLKLLQYSTEPQTQIQSRFGPDTETSQAISSHTKLVGVFLTQAVLY